MLEAKNRAKRFAGFLILCGICFFICGCYESEYELFSAYDAVNVYNLAGNYNLSGGGTMTLWAVPSSNDYRFEEKHTDGKPSTGYLRAVPLKGNIYIVQVQYDDADTYFYEFCSFDSSTRMWYYMKPASYDSEEEMAKKHNVKINMDMSVIGLYLEGNRADIRAFLLGCGELNMVEDNSY